MLRCPTPSLPACPARPRDLGSLLTGIKIARLAAGWLQLQREQPEQQLQQERHMLLGLATQLHSFLGMWSDTLLLRQTDVVPPFAEEQVWPCRSPIYARPCILDPAPST